MVRPARIAPRVGTSPAAPTMADTTTSAWNVGGDGSQALDAGEELRAGRRELAGQTIDRGVVEERHRRRSMRAHELRDQGDIGPSGRQASHPELVREGRDQLERPATDRAGSAPAR